MAIGSLDTGVIGHFDLLAGLSRFLGHHLFDGASLCVLHGHQRILVDSIGGNGDIDHRIGRSSELGVLSNEVGLAGETQHVGFRAHDARYDDTLRSVALGTFGNDQLTLLTDDVLSARKIAFGLHECILAIHHAGTGHLAELHYISSFDFHNLVLSL